MLKLCDGCFSHENCIIQEAIIRNKFTEKCPCSDCLVKMTCDDSKQVCDQVKLITTSIRSTIFID